ncbi:MAG: hypothetical protein HOP37_05115 [Cyclobacteriaceae bacterium]|nr:hypothetical protein [Cyclobacteriaceae bacterium]
MNLSKDEFVPNKAIRAIEASMPESNETSYRTLARETLDSDENILARIARLEGFYKGGIECSLSEN